MNREQKAAAVAEIAEQIQESEAVFAVDYRGITVPADRRAAHAGCARPTPRFRVVKNSLTERAADQAGRRGAQGAPRGPDGADLRPRRRGGGRQGDRRLPARDDRAAEFKGGPMNGDALDADADHRDLQAPVARGPVRPARRRRRLADHRAWPAASTALLSGLAVALGGVLEKKEAGEIPSGEAPAAAAAGGCGRAATRPRRRPRRPPTTTPPTRTPRLPSPRRPTEEPAEGPDTTEDDQED